MMGGLYPLLEGIIGQREPGNTIYKESTNNFSYHTIANSSYI
jgi:hypothetical protein